MIKWEEKFATGVPDLDEQHKKIFSFLNDFENMVKQHKTAASIKKAIDFLEHYAKIHFNFEEISMTKYHCLERMKNKDDHQVFLDTVTKYRARFAKEGYTEGLLRELHRWIEKWITEHICTVDVHLKEYIPKK